MNELQNVINFYSDDGFREMYEEKLTFDEWHNMEIALEFIDKYWLSVDMFNNKWNPVFQTVFPEAQLSKSKMMFNEDFVYMAFAGGQLFVEDDYNKLINCMRLLGEESFVIIENSCFEKEPQLRFVFPVSLTWEELSNGAFMSAALLNLFHKDYFVIGNSGKWGKYMGNVYFNSTELLGFKKEYSDIFVNEFKNSNNEFVSYLPDEYICKLVK